MNELAVRPGTGIGPIDLGMTRDEAVIAAAAARLSARDYWRVPGAAAPSLSLGGQLFAHFGEDGHVAEVVAAISQPGDGELEVTCLDLDLTAPYEDVLHRMAAHGRVDETDPEYPGTSVFLELGLVLWADATAEELHEVHVEAILVRRPMPYPLD
jgi:hypothetical protein